MLSRNFEDELSTNEEYLDEFQCKKQGSSAVL